MKLDKDLPNSIIAVIFIYFSISFSVVNAQEQMTYDSLARMLREARKTTDFEKLADAYYSLSILEEKLHNNYERSFEYLSRALDYYKVVEDTIGTTKTRFQIARHQLENGMYIDALEELEKLKSYYQRVGDLEMSAAVELELFKIYFDKIDIKKAKQSLDLSRTYLDKIQDSELEINHLIDKIKYYDFIQELDTALVLTRLCIEESLLAGRQIDQARCLSLRGDIHFKEERFDSSSTDYLRSLQLLNEIPYSKDRLKVYLSLAENYEVKEEFENAYQYSKMYASLQDSILNENRVIAVNNITYKFESRQKNTEIKLLEREKEIAENANKQQKRALTVLALTLAGLLFGIYFIIRFYKEKIQNARIIEQQTDKINRQRIQELQDKIQINSMQSMINGQEIERERIAKDLHDSLGGLLSTIKLQVDNIRNEEMDDKLLSAFEHANLLLDTAVSEVRTISQNLQPGALSRLGLIPALNDLVNRYDSQKGPEVHFQHFDIKPELDQTIALGIYRIVQEILNNAIKHARASEVLVQLNQEEDEIIIHVEDDGIGFDPNRKYKSMGLENIKSRVNYLRGTIEIDSRPKEGTSFLIHIKAA